jgi:hypothetical protein
MKTLTVGWLLLLTTLLSACAPGTKEPEVRPTFPAYTGEPATVYLIPNDSSNPHDTQALSAVEAEALQNPAFIQRFKLIDSSAVNLALEQVAGAQRGLIDESTIAAIGNVLGAKVAISVSSSLTQTQQGGVTLFRGLVGNVGGSVRNEAQISVRVLNLETGEVMTVGLGAASQSTDSAAAFLEAAQKAIDKMLLGYVARAG